MAYTKTSWVARVGTALNRFLKTNETSTEVELTNDPTGVTTAGTPFTVANMNKIEQGIYDAHYPAFTEAETLENIATGEEGTTLWGKVKKAISAVITHDGYLNQGVKTTDSPTFVNVHSKVNDAEFYTGGAKKAMIFGGTKTEDAWYQLLLPYFPNIGDKVWANGWLVQGQVKGIVVYGWREANAINILCSNPTADSSVYIDFRSGITETVYGEIVL